MKSSGGKYLLFLFLVSSMMWLAYKRSQLNHSVTTWNPDSKLVHQMITRGRLMIAIPLLEQRGYIKFTSSVLRQIHGQMMSDVRVFFHADATFSRTTLLEWYGEDATLVQYHEQQNFQNGIFEILRYFNDSGYEHLLIVSCDMIVSSRLFQFITNNSSNADVLLTYRNDTNCVSTQRGFCLESRPRLIGSVIGKDFAQSLLIKRYQLQDHRGIDWTVIGDNVKALSPVDSFSIRIGQHCDGDKCSRYAEAMNFDRCQFTKYVQDGIEFYLDKCNSPDKIFDEYSAGNDSVFYSKPAVVFSLYGGANPRYTDGAVENAKLMSSIYPGWKMWLYHDESVPHEILSILCKNDVKLVPLLNSKISPKRAWRFLIAEEKVARYLIRDIDSRLTLRERAAVEEWINSGKSFHVMRDHPAHTEFAMNAGMWGSIYGTLPQMRKWLENGALKEYYHQDQDFLTSKVWPIASKSVFQHDSFPSKFGEVHPFPTERRGYEHVGSVLINGKLRDRAIEVMKRGLEELARKKSQG